MYTKLRVLLRAWDQKHYKIIYTYVAHPPAKTLQAHATTGHALFPKKKIFKRMLAFTFYRYNTYRI